MSAIIARPSSEDLEPTAAMLNEHSRRLHGADDATPGDLLDWESPDVEFGQDILVAENDDGIVGYADVGRYAEHIWLDVRATDASRSPTLLLGDREVAAAKKPDAGLMAYTSADDEPLRDLLSVRLRGRPPLVPHAVDLDSARPEPEWPDGFTRPRDARGRGAPGVRGAQRLVRRPVDVRGRALSSVWRHWFIDDAAFDPSLWFVAEHGDDVAGIVIARAAEYEPGSGGSASSGSCREYRQRGLGQALLRHTFAEFESRGFDAVGLGVDAESPTGAVRVYERAGMHVERTNLLLRRSG